MTAGFGCGGVSVSGKRFLSLVFVTLFSLLIAHQAANAAVPATCDPKYWESIQARAWMEAQREIAQNQNLIYKADSVLEYSCFDKFLQVLATNALSLFSENESIFGVEVPQVTPTSMDEALEKLVAAGLQQYINGAFGHTFLGGRSSQDSNMGSASGGSGTYSCDSMAKVWAEARCFNFNQTSSIDDFFQLSKYNGWDPRSTLPTGFTCSANPQWQAKQDLATNTNKNYKDQVVQARTNFFDATSCAAPPIKTGIRISKKGNNPSASSEYDEYICVNPGCGLNKTGTCVKDPTTEY